MKRRPAPKSPAGAPLLFGFGQEGEGALPWLAQNAAALFTILLCLLLIALLVALVYAVVRELRRNTVLLDPVDAPTELVEKGFVPTAIAELLLDEIAAIQRALESAKPRRDVDSSAALIDIQVPGRFSLQAIVRYARRLARMADTHISGNVFSESGSVRLLLRCRERELTTVICDRSGSDLAALLKDAAIDVLAQVDPYVAAMHLLRTESAKSGFERTLAVVDHILKRRPAAEHAWAHVIWGHVLIRLGRYQEALEKQDAGLALEPEHPILASNRGFVLLMLGRLDDAMQQIKATLARGRGFEGALRDLALIRWSRHRYPAALRASEQSMAGRSADNRSLSLGIRARMLVTLGRAQEALDSLRDAGDGLFESWGRGAALLALGNAAAARAQFESACERSPNDPFCVTGLGDALAALGEHAAAAARYREAVTMTPKLSFPWVGWGRLLTHQGDLAGASAKFEEGCRVDPHDPALYRAWAEVLERQGRAVEATEKRRVADATESRNAVLEDEPDACGTKRTANGGGREMPRA